MVVCTQVASSRSLRPLVTLACRASSTTRTLSRMQRLRAQGVGPANERVLVGHHLKIDATEPALYQTVGHPLGGFLVAPSVQGPGTAAGAGSLPPVSNAVHAPA